MFYLKTIHGDDIVSHGYNTHQAATWHLHNDRRDNKREWATDNGDLFVEVVEIDDYVEEWHTCDKCGKKQLFIYQPAMPDKFELCNKCGSAIKI